MTWFVSLWLHVLSDIVVDSGEFWDVGVDAGCLKFMYTFHAWPLYVKIYNFRSGNPGELFIKLTSIFFYALLNHGLLCEYFCSTVISHTSQILNNIFDRFDNEILIFKTIRQTNGNTDFFQVSAKLTWWCSRWPLIFTTSSSSPSTWATSAFTSDSWWGIEFFHFDVYVNRFT